MAYADYLTNVVHRLLMFALQVYLDAIKTFKGVLG